LFVELVGRDEELQAVDDFLARPPPGALVLEGPAGIGKTSLWQATVDKAQALRLRVLSTRPASEDAQFDYAGLADLFAGVDVKRLPPPQRRALESALLVRDEQASAHAVAVAVLGALAALGAVLVAIDDVQWLDDATTTTLAFVARRLPANVRFLLAKRTPSSSPLEPALARGGLERLPVDPLTFGATSHLLLNRLDLTLGRPSARRLYVASGGNPLFALELGRAIVERGGRIALDEDVPIPESIEALLADRISALEPGVRTLLLAAAIGGGLDVAAVDDETALDDAVDAGVLVVEGTRVRVAHPLIGAVAQSRARPAERRALHASLAETSVDDELRARHLAHAQAGEDEGAARIVAAASVRASGRGSAATAAELATLALRLTPAASPERAGRLVFAAERLYQAGELAEVLAMLEPEVAGLPGGTLRAKALMLIGDCTDWTDYWEQAWAESGLDDALRSEILSRQSYSLALAHVARIEQAESFALESVELGRASGDAVAEAKGLEALAWTRILRGRAIDDVHEEWRRVATDGGHLYSSVDRIAAIRLFWRGELARAKQQLEALLAEADVRGESESYFALRLQLCELELRSGEFDSLAARLEEWRLQSEDAQGTSAALARCRAFLAVARGDADEAARLAADAVALPTEIKIEWHRLEGLRALTLAALLAGDPAPALPHAREVWEWTRREGIDDPGAFPVCGDYVEALAATGSLDTARTVTAEVERLAAEQEHPWALATAARCRGHVALAARDDPLAAVELGDAAARFGELGFQWDTARMLVHLGIAQRRLRLRTEARRSLEEAVRVFEELGSRGWAGWARAELGRVGGRTASEGLTPTEQRVAELVAQGLSNKEVAAALVVSVKSVEANLTRIYAKLGVRSRTELARRL